MSGRDLRKAPAFQRLMLRFNTMVALLAWPLFGYVALTRDWTVAFVPLLPTAAAAIQWASMCATHGTPRERKPSVVRTRPAPQRFDPVDPRTGLDPADETHKALRETCPLCGMHDPFGLEFEETTWHGWPAHWACTQTVREASAPSAQREPIGYMSCVVDPGPRLGPAPSAITSDGVRRTMRPVSRPAIVTGELRPSIHMPSVEFVPRKADSDAHRPFLLSAHSSCEVRPAGGLSVRVGKNIMIRLPAADPLLPRTDVVFRVQDSGEVGFLAGRADAHPVAPALATYCRPLAYIGVPPAATDLYEVNIISAPAGTAGERS